MGERDYRELRELRAHHPEEVAAAAARRARRPLLAGEHQLLLIAADHPARGALGAGCNPTAMGDRGGLLDRLRVALGRPGVDGVVATPDIVEDLLLLGALEGRLVFGSMNRGGLSGAVFELDDRFTGYDAATIGAHGLDGGKMLCRIAPDDAGTVATLEACGRAVTALAGRRLAAMIEPFWCARSAGRVRVDYSTDAVVRSVAVAAALGATSAYTWLKVPVVEDMDRVLAATTLPVVLLGGDVAAERDEAFACWAKALALPGVRGLAVGRNLLYPADDDVAGAVDAAAALLR